MTTSATWCGVIYDTNKDLQAQLQPEPTSVTSSRHFDFPLLNTLVSVQANGLKSFEITVTSNGKTLQQSVTKQKSEVEELLAQMSDRETCKDVLNTLATTVADRNYI